MEWDQGVVRITVQFANDGTVVIQDHDANGAVVETENGTWTAQGGALTVTTPSDNVNLTYQINGNLLVTTQVEDGSQVVIRWVKVVNLTSHEAQLVRSWRVLGIEVNGADTPPRDLFEGQENIDTAVFQLLADGTFRAFGLNGAEVVTVIEASWATGGGAIAVTDPEGSVMRGSYIASNTSVTLLDAEGDTVKFELTPWAPAANRAPALVGTWQAQSATVNGTAVNLDEFFEWEPNTASMSVYFYADGAFISAELDNNSERTLAEFGTWSTVGNALTITVDEAMVMTYAVAGNTATLTMQQDGDQVVLTFTRTT